jgi:hypothetical protein
MSDQTTQTAQEVPEVPETQEIITSTPNHLIVTVSTTSALVGMLCIPTRP